jgi:hypothetical protein
VFTADTEAVKVAEVAPAATVNDEGTVTDVLLLDRLTNWPLFPAAVVSVAVHVSVPAPVIDSFVQVRPLSVASSDPGFPPALFNALEPQPPKVREVSRTIGKLESQLRWRRFRRPLSAHSDRFSR